MSSNEYKTQKHFVKDGDDDYAPRRPMRRPPATGGSTTPRQPHKKCGCGGKLKPRGTIGVAGRITAKCVKCGQRTYTQTYKGKDGLAECY